MSATVDISIPITLELAPSLEVLVQHRKLEQFKRRLAADVSSLLEQLGLPGEPVIDVSSVNSKRPVRVRVHGALQPFEPVLLAQAWLAVAPLRLRYLPDSSFGRQTFSPASEWFGSFVNANKESSDANVATDCLRRLVVEVIRRSPGCLVGPAQARAYIAKANPTGHAVPESIRVDPIESILKSVLNLGVSAKSPVLWQTIGFESGTDVSEERITEFVFAQLRSNHIEIHLNPEYLKKLSPAFQRESDLRAGGIKGKIRSLLAQLRAATFAPLDPAFSNLLIRLEEKFFAEFGVRLPETVLLPSADIPDQLIAFKINDRLLPPTLGLKPEELLVHDSMGRLATFNLKARPAINPLNGEECGVIDAASREVAEQNDLGLSDASEFIVLALYGELCRQADQLLSIDDVEYQLARLETTCPSLVKVVAARYSSTELTQTMRGLLAEELSIRNPKEIFERLVQFDTIPCYDDQYKIFDDRLPVNPGSSDSLVNYREFLRSGLVNYISYKYALNQDSLPVIRIESVSDDHTNGGNESLNVEKPRPVREVEEESFRDKIWTLLMTKPLSSAPVIVTSNVLRPTIRRLTSSELPQLAVLAESELKPAINFNTIGTINFLEQ